MTPLPAGTRLLHVGPHKTGTTAIQVALDAAGPDLAQHGAAYVTIGGYRPRRAAWALGVEGLPEGVQRPPMKAWDRLVQAVADAGSARACVSNEDFGRAEDTQVRRIVADLGGGRPHVLAATRRLDRYLPSQWQQRVKVGEQRSYEDWLRVVLDVDSTTPDWDRRNVWFSHDVTALVDRWAAAVGDAHVTLVVLDESDRSQLPRTFEGLLGLPEGFLVVDESRSNRSLSWVETELVRAMHQRLGERGSPLTKPERSRIREVMQSLQAHPAGGTPSSPPLPQWALGRVRELSEHRVRAIEALAERGVEVVGSAGLMRLPTDLAPAPSPLVPPPLSVDVAGHVLAAAVADPAGGSASD